MSIVSVKDLHKSYRVYHDRGATLKERILFRERNFYENRKVINGISFELGEGDAIGLIGENGCGKSTLLKLLSLIIYPDHGSIEIKGRVSSLIELGAGFHPDMNGRENIYINASIFGLSKKEIDNKIKDIISFSELENYIDNPVRTYSSGMYMRLAFSVAINVNADILLIDEILAVGDANFQQKCFNELRKLKSKGVTIVLVTHDTGTVERFCDQAIWLKSGEMMATGEVTYVVNQYRKFLNSKILNKEDSKNSEASVEHFGILTSTISKVVLLNQYGEETSTFESEKSFTMQLYYETHDKVDEYVFGMGFNTLEGVNLYGNNTQIDQLTYKNIPEKGMVEFRIPKLPLLSGLYGLNVSIVSVDGTPIDFYPNYFYFNVVSQDRSVGFFSIPHRWSLADKLGEKENGE